MIVQLKDMVKCLQDISDSVNKEVSNTSTHAKKMVKMAEKQLSRTIDGASRSFDAVVSHHKTMCDEDHTSIRSFTDCCNLVNPDNISDLRIKRVFNLYVERHSELIEIYYDFLEEIEDFHHDLCGCKGGNPEPTSDSDDESNAGRQNKHVYSNSSDNVKLNKTGTSTSTQGKRKRGRPAKSDSNKKRKQVSN